MWNSFYFCAESQTRNQADYLRENSITSLKNEKSQKPRRVDNIHSEKSVSPFLPRVGSLQKEVRFRDEVGLLEATTNTSKKQVKGEFVKETTAFRAAMDYSNDDDDDDVDEGEGIGCSFKEQRESSLENGRHFGSEREIYVSHKLNKWSSQGMELHEKQMKNPYMNNKDEYYKKEDDGEAFNSWQQKRKEGSKIVFIP